MQLFVNDLTVMDFSYLCSERGMVGESWIVDVILNGDLNEESMVLDFGHVKKDLKRLIDLHIDHKLLVPIETDITHIIHEEDAVLVDFMRSGAGTIHLNCPAEAYAFIYAENITQESVGKYLQELITTHMPQNVLGIELQLRVEVINTPYYHYTHGLKKHEGNCQRIAHGHRSKVTVYEGQQESIKWQEYWAERWQDIYIGTASDIVSDDAIRLSPLAHQQDLSEHYLFAYDSSQGRFEMAIAKSECEIVQTDTTVECLAQYMADEQKKLCKGAEIKVVAYEGVGKGAIAYA
jgi:6-pyruvoyl-tetrahydropterin synthase